MKVFKQFGRVIVFLLLGFSVSNAAARDLDEIRQEGVLRHLGIPYANFVTGLGDGLDVVLVRGFAKHIGVRYEFVESSWKTAFGDLTGRHVDRSPDGGARFLGPAEIKGDILANGVTVLPWREQVFDYSDPTFPSGVWLIARADSQISPIPPSGRLQQDIRQVKTLLDGKEVLALENTCLDPALYDLDQTGANVLLAKRNVKLNEMAPAILNNEAESTLLDVPDALIALEKWPGELKVIGPVSGKQVMGAGFRKSSPELRRAFNEYLNAIKGDGTYRKLVQNYYPTVFSFFEDFFITAQ